MKRISGKCSVSGLYGPHLLSIRLDIRSVRGTGCVRVWHKAILSKQKFCRCTTSFLIDRSITVEVDGVGSRPKTFASVSQGFML